MAASYRLFLVLLSLVAGTVALGTSSVNLVGHNNNNAGAGEVPRGGRGSIGRSLRQQAHQSMGVNEDRKLALQRLAGYQPRTQVTDHAALDEDQASMEEELFLGKILKARNVYQEGGHSKSYAQLTLISPKGPAAFSAGTDVYGKTQMEGEVFGTLAEDAIWGANNSENITAYVQYTTSDIQGKHVSCQVGGLYTFYEANKYGCFNDSGSITIFQKSEDKKEGASVLQYEYDIRQDNRNGRTLERLSTTANSTMRKGAVGCSICPFIDDFQIYYDFYGNADYANKWWHAASYNKTTNFMKNRGMADFSNFQFKTALAEAMARGSVILNVWMSVIRGIEDAISDCMKECDIDDCNEDPVHSLDEAVAYYVGSREGKDGSGDGKFLYDLADRMATQFKTAGEFGTEEEGTALANLQAIREFKKAQLYLLQGECDKAIEPKQYIVNNMKVPLVQGLLKTAYTRQYENPVSPEQSEKVEAEGATYLAALLPYVHECNVEDGHTLYRAMHVGSSPTKINYANVKAALENNYDCLGIECKDVGGIWTVNGYADGAEPCGGVGVANSKSGLGSGSSSSGEDATNAAVAAGASIGAIFAALLMIFMVVRFRGNRRNNKKRQNSETSQRRASNIAAVTEIS